MPSMPKSPPELVARFDAVAADFPRADRRLTFGSEVVDDDAAIRRWVERAVDFGTTLPPKASKAAKTLRASKT